MKRVLGIAIPVFVAVLGAHFAWVALRVPASPWAPLADVPPPTAFERYLAGDEVWLGLSYATAAGFVALCLARVRQDRRAAAGAVGGVTLFGALAAAGCFLMGCCGSPMLAVYLGLLGPRFLGFRGPLVLALTVASVAVGGVWLGRRRGACCTSSCCGEAAAADARFGPWVDAWIDTPAGRAPRVRGELRLADGLRTLKARLAVNRTHYAVPPGLYALGAPGAQSPVLVSANYKMSFDRLRSAMAGRDAWILVLDTKGINVWCAAGKGTFGTDEIVHRVEASGLADVVGHRTLIVPQLGAPGVAAHEVRSRSGFRVVYGPVRAQDLPAFLDAGMKASPEMRRVRFTLADRLVLVPVEIIAWPRLLLAILLALLLLGGIGREGYSVRGISSSGLAGAGLFLSAFLCGAVATPVLLPWLPGRAFSVKGAVVGLAAGVVYALCSPFKGLEGHLDAAAWLLIMTATAAFCALNFTGASTYTSLSGVRKETRFALPAQIAGLALGLALWVASRLA